MRAKLKTLVNTLKTQMVHTNVYTVDSMSDCECLSMRMDRLSLLMRNRRRKQVGMSVRKWNQSSPPIPFVVLNQWPFNVRNLEQKDDDDDDMVG